MLLDDQERRVIGYYHLRESAWGYRLLLRGTRHFGYYPHGRRAGMSMARAQRLMEDRLGEALALPPGALVLDAGCGEGHVAGHIARRFGLRIEGVDLLDVSIARARRSPTPGVNFRVGSYARLPFADATFAGVYTMETLVHATDHRQALAEFHRVLEPGGRLVLVEYSMPPQDELTDAQRRAFAAVNEGSGMYSFAEFTHGRFPEMLAEAGFDCVSTVDVMPNVVPMLRRLHDVCYLPYAVGRLFGRVLVNSMAGVEMYRLRHLIGYNIVVGTRRPL